MKIDILSKIQKYKGGTFSIINQIVQFENIGIIEFEFIERDEVALIIPFKTKEKIIILKQYRASINNFIIEFPAGKKKKVETIYETAIRELKEETGYKATKIEQIGTFFMAPHFTNEKIYVFVATDLEFGFFNHGEKEIISPKEVSLRGLLYYQGKNLLLDAKTNMALTMLKNWKDAEI
jgi:ADP-ribose pyrophosphatase